MPKPFVWTADPDKIIAAVKRGTKCWIRCGRPCPAGSGLS